MSQKLSKSGKWKWNTLYAIKFFWHEVQAWFDFNNLGSENCLTYAILQFLLAFFFHFRHPVVWLSANFLSNFPGKCDSYIFEHPETLCIQACQVIKNCIMWKRLLFFSLSMFPLLRIFRSITPGRHDMELPYYFFLLDCNCYFWSICFFKASSCIRFTRDQ